MQNDVQEPSKDKEREAQEEIELLSRSTKILTFSLVLILVVVLIGSISAILWVVSKYENNNAQVELELVKSFLQLISVLVLGTIISLLVTRINENVKKTDVKKEENRQQVELHLEEIRQKAETERQRNAVIANQFHRLLGEYKSVWRMWKIHQEDLKSNFTAPPNSQWELADRASAAEGEVEAVLVEIALERELTNDNCITLGLFRQGYQRLRQSISESETPEFGYRSAEYRLFHELAIKTSSIILSAEKLKDNSDAAAASKRLLEILAVRSEDWNKALVPVYKELAKIFITAKNKITEEMSKKIEENPTEAGVDEARNLFEFRKDDLKNQCRVLKAKRIEIYDDLMKMLGESDENNNKRLETVRGKIPDTESVALTKFLELEKDFNKTVKRK
jgi:uncharacterized membrane-anchored protein YhcB (DUF1043 family)